MSRCDATDSLTLLKSTQSLTPLLACVNLLRRVTAKRLDQCLIPAFARAGTAKGQSSDSLARETRPQRDLFHRSLSKKYQELSDQFCTQSKPSSRSLPRMSITTEAMAVGGMLTIIVDAIQIADHLLADCFR